MCTQTGKRIESERIPEISTKWAVSDARKRIGFGNTAIGELFDPQSPTI